jgi:hypothetical protein
MYVCNLCLMRVHSPVRAQNAAFAAEYGPGHVTSHALKEFILKHKVVIIYLDVISSSINQRYEF